MNGWIALYRKLLTWQWHDEPKMVALWVHILLRACREETKYHGITLQRGQFAMSIRGLAVDVGFSVKEIRLRLKRLIADDCISIQRHGRAFSVVSVTNFDQYQRFDDIVEKTQRAHLNDCNCDNYSDNENNKGTIRAHQKAVIGAHQGHVKGHTEGTQKGTQRAHLTNCVSEPPSDMVVINRTQNDTQTVTETATNTAPKWETKGHNNNNNNNIYPPPPPSHADAYAREAGCGTPPTGSGDGEADVGNQLQELLCDPAYCPIILMRSKMTVEEAFVHIPEFVAQCRLRGKTWKNIRELTEHFANWLQRKQTYLNEQKSNNNGTPPRGGDADERERHNAVVQTALGLMAGSTRDD